MYIHIFDHTDPRPAMADNDAAALRAASIATRTSVPRQNIRPRRQWHELPDQFPVLILLHSETESRQLLEVELAALEERRYALIHYSDGAAGSYQTTAKNTYARSIPFELLLNQPLEKWRQFFETVGEGSPDFEKLFDEQLPENTIAAYLLQKAGSNVPQNIKEAAKNECCGLSYEDLLNERFAN